MHCGPDPNGVTKHSPGWRSAPWVTKRTTAITIRRESVVSQDGAALALGYVLLPRCGMTLPPYATLRFTSATISRILFFA
jgi:hypothetical protein